MSLLVLNHRKSISVRRVERDALQPPRTHEPWRSCAVPDANLLSKKDRKRQQFVAKTPHFFCHSSERKSCPFDVINLHTFPWLCSCSDLAFALSRICLPGNWFPDERNSSLYLEQCSESPGQPAKDCSELWFGMPQASDLACHHATIVLFLSQTAKNKAADSLLNSRCEQKSPCARFPLFWQKHGASICSPNSNVHEDEHGE